MIYRCQSMLESDADVIICPTTTDDTIPPGSLHEELVCLLEAGYTKRHFAAIEIGAVKAGYPIVYYCKEDEWAGRWIINFPVDARMTYTEFMEGIHRCLVLVTNCDADAVAVPMPMEGVVFREDVQEWSWLFQESRVFSDKNTQVELITGDAPDVEPLPLEELLKIVEATA